MQRVERSARIGAPPEAVFAYLADLDNLAEWQMGDIDASLQRVKARFDPGT